MRPRLRARGNRPHWADPAPAGKHPDPESIVYDLRPLVGEAPAARLTLRCRRQHPPPSPRFRCARPRLGLRVLRLSSMPFGVRRGWSWLRARLVVWGSLAASAGGGCSYVGRLERRARATVKRNVLAARHRRVRTGPEQLPWCRPEPAPPSVRGELREVSPWLCVEWLCLRRDPDPKAKATAKVLTKSIPVASRGRGPSLGGKAGSVVAARSPP